jgi:hypothetical protein
MKRFNKKGMLIIPNPTIEIQSENVLVVNSLFCQNGHSLINPRLVFNGYPGIVVKVKVGDKEGLIALSPIYGSKVRVAIDIDLADGEIIEIRCPECDARLPVYSSCTCGADLVVMFTSQDARFSDCIGVCTRVNCANSRVIISDELLSQSMVDVF